MTTFFLLLACGGGRGGEPPDVTITSHAAGDRVLDGFTTRLEAYASDPDGPAADLKATWKAGGGLLCAGRVQDDGVSVCEVVLPSGNLELTVADQDGNKAVARAAVRLEPASLPEVLLTLPEPPFYSDRVLDVQVVVADAEDPAEALVLAAFSDLDGELELARNPDTEGRASARWSLSEGRHALTVSATDRDGLVGEALAEVSVGGPATAPSCQVTSPADAGLFAPGDAVRLAGTVSDADIPETDLLVTWNSSRDGELAEGPPAPGGLTELTVDTLSVGNHTLTLRAEDDAALTCSDAVDVLVDRAPRVAWLSPADGALWNEGEEVVLVASVEDDEDAASDLVVTWSSDRDGELGSTPGDAKGTASQALSTLSAGSHRLTAVAEDPWGLQDAATVTVAVNGLPGAPVVTVGPSPAFTDDDLVASAKPPTDPEGDAVSLSWSWYVDGKLSGPSTGPTLPATATTRGQTWTVEVVATDGLGSGPVGSASVVVENTPPELSSVVVSPSSPVTTSTLTAVASATDADDDVVGFSYSWRVDGVFAGSGITLSGSAFEKGDRVDLEVVPRDGTDDGATGSAAVTIENSPPAAPGVALSPAAPGDDDDLVCVVTAASVDADGDAVSYAVAWQLDGVPWPEPPDSGMVPLRPTTTTWPDDTVPADATTAGQTWSCTVTPDDGDDVGGSAAASVEVAG